MFDLYQCHWVSGQDLGLHIANAPSMRAAIRFDMQCQWPMLSRRLDSAEAGYILQQSYDSGMQCMTFLHSAKGIACVQEMLAQPQISEAS